MRDICSRAAFVAPAIVVRVNAELTEAATGRHVWSETYDAEVKDIFAVQDDIARRVVGAAAVKLTRFERERVLAKPTENLVAYEYVLRGREFLSHATRDKNDEAAATFPARDRPRPELCRRLCGARRLAFRGGVVGMDRICRRTSSNEPKRWRRRPSSLDPMTTSAYRLLAEIDMYRGRYDLALGQIDRALEINPSDAESYCNAGRHFGVGGQSRGGFAVARRRASL